MPFQYQRCIKIGIETAMVRSARQLARFFECGDIRHFRASRHAEASEIKSFMEDPACLDLRKAKRQEQKTTAQRESFGPASHGRPGVIRAGIPDQRLRAGPLNLGKTSIWVRTSMTRTRGRP